MKYQAIKIVDTIESVILFESDFSFGFREKSVAYQRSGHLKVTLLWI